MSGCDFYYANDKPCLRFISIKRACFSMPLLYGKVSSDILKYSMLALQHSGAFVWGRMLTRTPHGSLLLYYALGIGFV